MKRSQVRPKKHLGQHFLRNEDICRQVAESLTGYRDYKHLIEIGPGTGALTKFLLPLKQYELFLAEVDPESVEFLKVHFSALSPRILQQDFLTMPLDTISGGKPLAVIGNFPYNISSQILFHVLEYRDLVTEVVGMFQKEVALRITKGPGTKDYGILSVLIQAYYDAEYLFTVDETEFIPPPRVKSGVIRLRRNNTFQLPCDEKLFIRVVKAAFNQRRKTLRNSLRSVANGMDLSDPKFNQRPEQLSVASFVELTNEFQAFQSSTSVEPIPPLTSESI